MPEEHMIFMEEYEKYGNNCTLIAKVLNTCTPAQIKKDAECFFRKNVKTNSAAVRRYRETLSSDKKTQTTLTFPPQQKKWQNHTTVLYIKYVHNTKNYFPPESKKTNTTPQLYGTPNTSTGFSQNEGAPTVI